MRGGWAPAFAGEAVISPQTAQPISRDWRDSPLAPISRLNQQGEDE